MFFYDHTRPMRHLTPDPTCPNPSSPPTWGWRVVVGLWGCVVLEGHRVHHPNLGTFFPAVIPYGNKWENEMDDAMCVFLHTNDDPDVC